MLDMSLALCFFTLTLHLDGELAPLAEETGHILHPVVCVEESCHSIEKVLVPM